MGAMTSSSTWKSTTVDGLGYLLHATAGIGGHDVVTLDHLAQRTDTTPIEVGTLEDYVDHVARRWRDRTNRLPSWTTAAAA